MTAIYITVAWILIGFAVSVFFGRLFRRQQKALDAQRELDQASDFIHHSEVESWEKINDDARRSIDRNWK